MRNEKQTKQDYFRAKENASKYHWDRMTKEEKDWLIAFEVSEHEAERGHISEAVDALIGVGVVPSDKYVNDLRGRWAVVRRVNPLIAETANRNDKKRSTGSSNTRNSYASTDWVEVDSTFTQVTGDGSGDIYERSTAVTESPEDGMIEAIDQARSKSRSLEKLIEDAKLSKEAKAALIARTQGFVYAGTTYSKHANLILDMNYILKGQDGLLWVQDQHGRLQSLALYLKRRTSETIVTHAEVSYPEQLEIWVFKPGHRADIEGKAVKYETV